jgi:hypothetical protein
MVMHCAKASEKHKIKHAVICTIEHQQQQQQQRRRQQQPTPPWVDGDIF